MRERTPEQKARYLAAQKAKRDAAALAAGRVPGQIGQPPKPKLSDEERKEKRRLKSAAWRVANLEKAREYGRQYMRTFESPASPDVLAERHAKRLEVQKANQKVRYNSNKEKYREIRRASDARMKADEPNLLTGEARKQRGPETEDRKSKKAASTAAWYQANQGEVLSRAIERQKQQRDARALAEGRVPGTLGHLSTFTAEELRVYREEWPEQVTLFRGAIKSQNSRAKRLGLSGRITLRQVLDLYVAQVGHCAFCARPLGARTPHIDHWLPLAIGGDNVIENIRLLHDACNQTKGHKHPSEFGFSEKPPALPRSA